MRRTPSSPEAPLPATPFREAASRHTAFRDDPAAARPLRDAARACDALGLQRGDRLLLAVSGGADSLALAALLARLAPARGWELRALSVNHGLRAEAAADAAHAADICQRLGIPCRVVTVDVPGLRQRGEGMEEAARRLRYAALEEERQRRYGDGAIIFKCNQLVDPAIIRALYRASMAGVRIRLQVRGICCLRPGLPGISETIEVSSIVGRFLEHSRIYWFHAGGEGLLYMGSADLMPRNLDRRIEVLAPITDPQLRATLLRILECHLRDNVQSWRLRDDAIYERLAPAKDGESVNAQALMMAGTPGA